MMSSKRVLIITTRERGPGLLEGVEVILESPSEVRKPSEGMQRESPPLLPFSSGDGSYPIGNHGR